MHVYYSDTFTFPLPDGHRFPLVKYRLLRDRILQQPATCGAELRLAPRATRWQNPRGSLMTYEWRNIRTQAASFFGYDCIVRSA